MATLTGTKITDTYEQLIKLDTETLGADDAAKWLETGKAEDLPIAVSTTRVGIGTTTPLSLLHIEGDISTVDSRLIISATGLSQANFVAIGLGEDGAGADANVAYIAVDQVKDLCFGEMMDSNTGSLVNEWMRIDSNGAVGIGTSTPASLLHVESSSATDNVPTITIAQKSTTAAHTGGNLHFLRGDPDAHLLNNTVLGEIVWFGRDHTDDDYLAAARIKCTTEATPDNNDMPADITFWTNDGQTAAEHRMVISAAGNVGIGTTSPAGLLEVNTSGGTIPGVKIDCSSGHSTTACIIKGNDTTDATLEICQQGGGDIMRVWDGNIGDTEVFTIIDGGKVGIGDTTPAYKFIVHDTTTGYVAEIKNLSTNTSADCAAFTINAANDTLTTGGFWVGCYDYAGLQGGIRGVGGSGVALDTSSDRRLKDDIVDIPDALSMISSLKPRNFYWKSHSKHSNKPVQYGFIADEYEAVFPGTVNGKRDADGKLIPDAMKTVVVKEAVEAVAAKDAVLDSDGNVIEAAVEAVEASAEVTEERIFTQLIDSNRFTVPVLVKAIQELSAKVTALENA
jgi:hypothetical protein